MKSTKKFPILFFSFIIMFSLSSAAFASATETYFTVAYNYGIFTERAENAQTKLNAHAIDLSLSSYFNENWGLYLNTGYNFPSSATVTSGGTSVTATSSDWDFSMLLSVILGPTFKFDINDAFQIFGGFGFHMAEYVMTTEYVNTLNFSFGIGGDVGVRYLPSKNFYLTGGFLFSHDFYQVGSVKTAHGTTDISDSYNFGSFRPYIGLGFNFSEFFK